MQRQLKRVFVLAVALVFIVLGLAGLVLPFLQGFLFLAIGILLLSLYSPSVREWMDRHTVKYPKLHRLVLKAEGWVTGIIGKP